MDYRKNFSEDGINEFYVECDRCKRTVNARYAYYYPNGSVICVPCAGKRINLVGRKRTQKRTTEQLD